MVICKAPLTGGYSEALSAWQAGENKSLSALDVLEVWRFRLQLRVIIPVQLSLTIELRSEFELDNPIIARQRSNWTEHDARGVRLFWKVGRTIHVGTCMWVI